MVIDHFGHVGFEGGMDRPVIRWVLDMLKQENWWMMVSNGNRDSRLDAGWDDALPYGKAFIEAAPERIVWGTDWPHPQWTKRMMNERRRSRTALPLRRRRCGVAAQDSRRQSGTRLHGFEK